jgi:hypothetical protein
MTNGYAALHFRAGQHTSPEKGKVTEPFSGRVSHDGSKDKRKKHDDFNERKLWYT